MASKNHFVMSALMCASEEGNLNGLEELLTHVANAEHVVNMANELGETAMHVAAGSNHLEVLRLLESKGARIVVDKRGDSPLFWAARNGHLEIVEYLFTHNVAVDQRNKCQETPLHCACRYGHFNVVEFLCKCGANPNLLDEHQESPLHIACWFGFPLLVQLICAVRSANLDIQNKDGESALICAASRGHLECVQTLLAAKADLNVADKQGQTALHLAIRRHHFGIILALLHSNCRFDLADNDGNTALHLACQEGLLTVVQALCALGCQIDIANKASLYPMHISAKEGHIDIVRCLILAGGCINVKNKDGLSPEITALAQGNTEVGDLLSKLKNEQVKDSYIAQLIPDSQTPLKRIKLKVFGHSAVGKTKLLESLRTGFIGSFFRRRENSTTSYNGKDEHSPVLENGKLCLSGRRSKGEHRILPTAAHPNYTRGIDVQSVSISGAGEYSTWEFSGFEPYHQIYDHFVGNTDCLHLILFRLMDPTEVQYNQALYWLNFLQGRIMPTEPIGQEGLSSKPAYVVLIGTHADQVQPPLAKDCASGEWISSEVDAMLKTLRHRFACDFDICDRPILVDAHQSSSTALKALKAYLQETKNQIVQALPRSSGFLDESCNYLTHLRKAQAIFPVVPWPGFIELIRKNVNPLAGEVHCRQLIQQLQLMGEVVYLKGDVQDYDYVIYNPSWLCHDIVGQLLSAEFMTSYCRLPSGSYTLDDIQLFFPDIPDPTDLLQILDALCLCSQYETEGDIEYEFPGFILSAPPQKCFWELRQTQDWVYGGIRLLPPHGMSHMLGVMWPRVQVQLRRSMQEFNDPVDADLSQWSTCSRLCSGSMEGYLCQYNADQGIEVKVRAPPDLRISCFYFLEDLCNIVEQVVLEIAPGLPLERHFLSPRDLVAHAPQPLAYPPQAIISMQLEERMKIRPPPGSCAGSSSLPASRFGSGGTLNNNKGEAQSPTASFRSFSVDESDEDWEAFVDVVCFGAKEIALSLTLGVDLPVAQIPICARRELAELLDPSDATGRDWVLLMLKLGLTEQLPEVDCTGPQLSKTDQVLAEWCLNSPNATIGMLLRKLKELGRADAVAGLCRAMPLYMFAPVEESSAAISPSHVGAGGGHASHDSGVASAGNSHSNSATSQRSNSTLSH